MIMPGPGPTIVGVGGFESNVGKTTLMCRLLSAFPGWEAIKTTRGHYRSCGKDPRACCVSHLLGDQPVVRSGREETYAPGKDTGRYWDAGAANVHWVIATEEQVGAGMKEALERVRSGRVFIEGNTFSESVNVELMVMVKRPGTEKIKRSATRALARTSLVYLSSEPSPENGEFRPGLFPICSGDDSRELPVYSSDDFPQLVARVRQIISTSTS